MPIISIVNRRRDGPVAVALTDLGKREGGRTGKPLVNFL